MSGLEFIALVPGIIGAFAKTASYLRERHKKKSLESASVQKKKHRRENKDWERELGLEELRDRIVSASKDIHVVWMRDVERGGRAFKRGDGGFDPVVMFACF